MKKVEVVDDNSGVKVEVDSLWELKGSKSEMIARMDRTKSAPGIARLGKRRGRGYE